MTWRPSPFATQDLTARVKSISTIPTDFHLLANLLFILHAKFSMIFSQLVSASAFVGCIFSLSSCAYMSQTGPQKGEIIDGEHSFVRVDVNSRADIPSKERYYGLGEVPPSIRGSSYSDEVRTRDSLLFTITDLTEASPFFSPGAPYSFGPIEVPKEGTIVLPYVGKIQVIGSTLSEISAELNELLSPVSNTARASVSRTGRIPKTANVIGAVKTPGPVALEREHFTSWDLLAVSGGPTAAEHLYKYILRRDNQEYVFDYLGFRRKSFMVEDGDLLTVTTDSSNRFYVTGAIMKPTTVDFPVPSPTLADALGAAAGLDVMRSDPSGVFIFRKGNPDRIYTFDLKKPEVMFLTQRFPIAGEDLVYITEAPLARWSRLISQILPFSQSLFNAQRSANLLNNR
jgi:polysaccharide export outer membrane protein